MKKSQRPQILATASQKLSRRDAPGSNLDIKIEGIDLSFGTKCVYASIECTRDYDFPPSVQTTSSRSRSLTGVRS